MYYIQESQQLNKTKQDNFKVYIFIKLTDKCSGLIPLLGRTQSLQINQLAKSVKLIHMEIHNNDRLGRTTTDIKRMEIAYRLRCYSSMCNPNRRN